MMIKDNLQNTATRKNVNNKAHGQVRPETVFLPSKYRGTPFHDNLPNIHSQIPCRFSVLFALKSVKK
jgi:hypothetical protein